MKSLHGAKGAATYCQSLPSSFGFLINRTDKHGAIINHFHLDLSPLTSQVSREGKSGYF